MTPPHSHLSGFSLIELMITLSIIAILSTISMASYHHLQQKQAVTSAKQALVHAVKQYHFYRLTSNYRLDNLDPNILFETNKYYDFDMRLENSQPVFIATTKNNQSRPTQQCATLQVNTHNQTTAFDANGQENKQCWGG